MNICKKFIDGFPIAVFVAAIASLVGLIFGQDVTETFALSLVFFVLIVPLFKLEPYE